MDLSSLPKFEKYNIDTDGIDLYDNQNLEINEYQAGKIKFIFSDSILRPYNEKTISGKYMLLTITGFGKAYDEPLNTGSIFAYIFYEFHKYAKLVKIITKLTRARCEQSPSQQCNYY